MPPIAKKAVLILVLATPAALTAQTVPSSPGVHLVSDSAARDEPWGSPVAGAKPIQATVAGNTASTPLVPPSTGATGRAEVTAAPSSSAFGEQTIGPRGDPDLPRLPPPGRPDPRGRSPAAPRGLRSLLTIGSSLAVVLGLFFLFAWTMRRGSPGGSAVLPGEVVEVLGRAPLTHRQQLHLLRCGRKLVLVNVCAEGVETLTEITEPEEVDRLLGLCRQSHPQSASATFRQVFQQFAGKDA